MRTFSSTVQSILLSGDIKFFILVELRFGTTYYMSSLPYEVTFNGNVYQAEGALVEYASPKYSSVVDREAYKIILSDLQGQIFAELRNGVVGRDIIIRAGFLDSNNQPLLGTTDVVSIYTGYVDSPQVVIDFNTKFIVIEGTSPMSDLDSVKPFYTSPDGMNQRSSTDTSFDRVFEGYDLEYKWGKV